MLAVWLAYTYQVADSTTEFLGERLNQLALGILLPGIALPLVIGLFIAAARPHTAPGTPNAPSDPWARCSPSSAAGCSSANRCGRWETWS